MKHSAVLITAIGIVILGAAPAFAERRVISGSATASTRAEACANAKFDASTGKIVSEELTGYSACDCSPTDKEATKWFCSVEAYVKDND